MSNLFRKVGKRYVEIQEPAHFKSDGIWLVLDDGRHNSRILKLGELPELFPFASMSMSRDELVGVLVEAMSVPFSPSDLATMILKWAATKTKP